MKQDPFSGVYRALTPKELAEMFMNPHAPKTEAEHWAVREIEKLTRELDEARAEVERLRDENATLRRDIGRMTSDRDAQRAAIKEPRP